MDELKTAIERLKRLPERQVKWAAREIGGYLTSYDVPFRPGRSLDELAEIISNLDEANRSSLRAEMLILAEQFEQANQVRATGRPLYFKTTYNLEVLRIEGWPTHEFSEVVGDYVIRKIWRTPEGAVLKESIDNSWSACFVTLSESTPYARETEVDLIEPISGEEFEAIWDKAEFACKEGDEAWEVVDTTAPTDPSFEPVLGAWTAADRSNEIVEFTLNGIVLWSRPNEPMQFFRYVVEGSDVRLDPESGQPAVRFVLQGDVLVDGAGHRFVRE